MKKAFIYILLACCTLVANAQTENYHKPILVQVTLSHPYLSNKKAISEFERIDYYYNNYIEEDHIESNNSPIINLGVYYDLAKYAQIGCEFLYLKCDATINESNSKTYHYKSIIYGSIFSARFTYAKQENFTMFSGASFGFGYEHKCKGHYEYQKEYFADVIGFGQLTVLGASIGKKLYGTFEVGYGYKGIITAGIGYKFN